MPLLHLSNSKKLWLDQEKHFDEIYIFLYQYFNENRDSFLEELEEDIEEMKKELEDDKVENLDKKKTGLEIAREKKEDKKKLQEQMRLELEKELGKEISSIAEEIIDIEEQEKIEEKTGFSNE